MRQKRKVTKINDRDHVLKRAEMYCGSRSLVTEEDYFLNIDGKFEYKSLQYVPAFLKIINEIIDNSIDECIAAEFKVGNKIEIIFDDSSKRIKIKDNGRGISVEKDPESREWEPVLAWCHKQSGSNWDEEAEDDGKIGLNGVGSYLTNVFSKIFIGTTSDGKNKMTVTSVNGAESYTEKKIKCSQNFTEVEFEPDLEKFTLTPEDVFVKDSIYKQLLYQRLLNLAMIYPEITFSMDKKSIKVKNNKTFLKSFGDSFESIETNDYFIGIFPNELDEFKFYSFLNGLRLIDGGNHIDLVSSDIVDKLKDKLSRRYKTIKPADVKNKLLMVFFAKNFKRAKFSTQTKEKLTNSTKEIRDYLGDIDFDALVNKIYKNDAIIEPIVEIFKMKEELKKRKELGKLKSKKTVKSVKYWPPIGENKILILAEGDSARGGLSAVLGRKNISYYAMRGVPLNSFEVDKVKLLKNVEMKEIIDIIGIDIDAKCAEAYNVGFVVLGTDSDLDGFHIRGLLIGFFNKYSPDLIERRMLKQLRTPLIVLKKKDEIKEMFFSINEFKEFESKKGLDGYKVEYKKGLGSWLEEDLSGLFKKFGTEYFLEDIVKDETADELIQSWLGKKESDNRKELLFNHTFSIHNI